MKEAHTTQNSKIDSSSDWVCLNCSNLNYSFRKICNRCKSVTRQQNHQNYLQMQYMHAYYHQPYPTHQDLRTNLESSPQSTPSPAHTYLDSFKIDEIKTTSRKQSSEGSQYSDFTDIKNVDWNNGETQGKFMFLLENAWEGLYMKTDVSQFNTCEEIENTREEEQEPYQNEDILTNFDFTFI